MILISRPYYIGSNIGIHNLSIAIVNSAIVDKDRLFFMSDFFKLINLSIDIDVNKLKVKQLKVPSWIVKLEKRLLYNEMLSD